ncbi:MAG: histidine phosphatase family protein [Bryobacteraceae bacterium]
MDIYILRHGLAEDPAPGMGDAGRRLVPEGKEKLREVMRLAKNAGVAPAVVLTSPYRRALETAQIAAEILEFQDDLIQTPSLLPASTPEAVWDEIRVHRAAAQVLLVGHEPLLGQLIAHLLAVPALRVDVKKASLTRIDVESFGPRPAGILRWLVTARLAASL